MRINEQANIKPIFGKSRPKGQLRGQLWALTMLAGFAFTSDAMARSDSILTVVTPSNAALSPDNITADESQAKPTSAPLDLTNLLKPEDADNASDDEVGENTVLETLAADNTSPTTTTSEDTPPTTIQTTAPTISLKRKDPSSIRLAAVGIDRDAYDGLDSLMWQGSTAETVLTLRQALANSAPPSSLAPVLHHLDISRVPPPEGFVDLAPQLIAARLDALSNRGASDDLAILIEQLPQEDQWSDWHQWLAVHNLLTRNDEAACTAAQDQVQQTLDPLWHQINTFCAVVAGQADQAIFALDILSDSGLSTPNFDQLMRQLIGQGTAGDLDLSNISGIDLVLMDSARITIDPMSLTNLHQGHQDSVLSLRYLSDESLRMMTARHFAHDNMMALKTSWALLPIQSVSSAEALTRFSINGDADEMAMARLDAWQAIAAEKDDRTAAQLAYEAMMIDYTYAGIKGFSLWLPIIERGANNLDLEDKIGPILGFSPESSRLVMSDEAMAWHDLLTFGRKPTQVETLQLTAGFDALPVLDAIKIPVENIDWMTVAAPTPALAASAAGNSLPYQGLMQLDVSATQGQKAETLMRAALLLDGVDLATLSRDDAAKVVSALHQVGLKDTARALSRDILVSWAAARHFGPIAPSQPITESASSS